MLERIRFEIRGPIAEVILNRPNNLNAMDDLFFEEIARVFTEIDHNENIFVAIIWAEGKIFSSGLDLKAASSSLFDVKDESRAVHSLHLFKHIRALQKDLRRILRCKKPVIAAIHSKCIGSGLDLISWCDYRICTTDATFSVKETQIAIVADLGTLQRLSRITSNGIAREMALTGTPISSERALQFGLVNQVFQTKEAMLEAARSTAHIISCNSPLTVQSTKIVLNYAEEHSVKDGLMQVALWNSSFLESEDLLEAFSSFLQKKTPNFRNKL